MIKRFILILLLLPMVAIAQTRIGVINSIDLESNRIVVDDWLYSLSINTMIKKNEAVIPRVSLKANDKVKLEFDYNPRTNVYTLKYIDILPNNYVIPTGN